MNDEVILSNLRFSLSRLFGDSKDDQSSEPIVLPANLSPEEAGKLLPIFIEKSFERLQIIKQQVEDANKQADISADAAHDAYNKEVGFWHRTGPALEALQSAVMSQSNAQIQLSKAQKLMFEQFQLLANFSKILFVLCVQNIACARIAIKEITLRMKQASEGEISDMAKQEMENLLGQLKNQMDMAEQQERLKKRVEKLEAKIAELGHLSPGGANLQDASQAAAIPNLAPTKNSHIWRIISKIGAVGLAIWSFIDLRNGRWVMTIIEVVIAFFIWAIASDDSKSPAKAPKEKTTND